MTDAARLRELAAELRLLSGNGVEFKAVMQLTAAEKTSLETETSDAAKLTTLSGKVLTKLRADNTVTVNLTSAEVEAKAPVITLTSTSGAFAAGASVASALTLLVSAALML